MGVARATVTAVTLVENQDDGDDEQKPRAIHVPAKQITHTHCTFSFLKAATALSFSSYAASFSW